MYRIMIWMVAISTSFFTSALWTPPHADDILGKWKPEEEDRIIEIYKDGEKYFGKVLEADGKAVKEEIIVLKDFTFIPGPSWEGKVYAPKRQKEFDATLTLEEESTLLLNVDAGFISKTVTWNRVD